MKLFWLLLFFCFTNFCSAQQRVTVAMPEAKFITGDNAGWASQNFDDNGWKTIKTGRVWQEQGFEDYHGFAWYRIHVVIPSSLKANAYWKDSLRIFLAHVNDADETFLNGTLIGKTGGYPSDASGYISKWPAERSYAVAAGSDLIHWNAENIIAVRVYDGGGTGGIFMGAPYIDMLEKTDGLVMSASPVGIRYDNVAAHVPLTIVNKFNTAINGELTVQVKDEESKKNVLDKKLSISLKPFETVTLPFTVPNKAGIQFLYSFIEKETGLAIQQNLNIPYILTPNTGVKPRINSPAVFGARPGSSFLFKIAATGQKPMLYKATGLPNGLRLDAATGVISGIINSEGDYPVNIVVKNKAGSATQVLHIKTGNLLALTPTMGWNSWNCWGLNINEERVKQAGQAFIDLGLIDYGWTYINIDDGWEAPSRNVDGTIKTNEKFQNMKGLGDWLHHRGLKFGIYSSPGPKTCGGYLGSYGYEWKDAASYTSWGIDYLKYDWCSYDGVAGKDTSLETYVKPYAIMDSALQNQNRDIIYSLCQYGMKEVWKWGSSVNAQSWRTTEDIEDTWQSMITIGLSQYPLYAYAGPGHWNDPDMMLVGQVGWGENLHPSRLTPDEQYTHVSLWCLLSAPLLIGCDLTKTDPFTLSLLTNAEVIAIDQDVLGKQAKQVIKNENTQTWVKELSDGSKAIGLFNLSNQWQTIPLNAGETGLPVNGILRDTWRQKDLGSFKSNYETKVPPHGVVLLTLREK